MPTLLIIHCIINCVVFRYTSQLQIVEIDQNWVSSIESVSDLRSANLYGLQKRGDDIKYLIDYIYLTEGLDKVVRKSYILRAESIASRIAMPLIDVLSWADREPNTLRNVLSFITQLRLRLEPKAKAIAQIVKQYPELEQELRALVNVSKASIKQIANFDIVCEANSCPKKKVLLKATTTLRPVSLRYKRSNSDKLYDEIHKKLNVAVTNVTENIKAVLTEKNTEYNEKISVVVQNFKAGVLKYYGITMYNLIEVQNDYITLYNNLNDITIKDLANNVNELLLLERSRLLTLQNKIAKYGHYCRTCQDVKGLMTPNWVSTRRFNTWGLSGSKSKNDSQHVDELIAIKVKEIYKNVKNDLQRTFSYVDDKFVELQNVDEVLKKMDPVKQELGNLTQNERHALLALQQIAPSNSIFQFTYLYKELQQLSDQVEVLIKKLTQIVG